jgi:hypothetical protein
MYKGDERRAKKNNTGIVIGWIIAGAIAVTGWMFGALQSAGAQTHSGLESRIVSVEKSIVTLTSDDAVNKTTLETIKSDVKEIKDILKKR